MSLKPHFLKPKEDLFFEDRSDVDSLSNTSFIYNPCINQTIQKQRQRLPVFQSRNHILYLLENYQTLIIVGETGSGKSTQVPQYLIESGWKEDGIVGVTEPRRVACTNLAVRVAEERNVRLGEEVGYSIRFDDCTSEETKIKYMTEGILIREMMADPLLRQYCVIMLDEVHERTIFTDIVMGLLKKIMKKRKDLKLIVSSATVDAEQLCRFFNYNTTQDKKKDTTVALTISGRNYPVDIFYLEDPTPDYVKCSVETTIKIHSNEGLGDVLIFLTSVEEVDRCVELLNEHLYSNRKDDYSVLAMHGSLPNHEQLKVFQSAPIGIRKIIVATNIAETSVTIPGVVYVIDCGFVKIRWYNADSHTDSLIVVSTSKASATQRAGRAGRTRSGKVYRLYEEDEFQKFNEVTLPEIQRSELSSAVINLMALGIDNMLRFDFPSPPPARHLTNALDMLFALKAVDNSGTLTHPLGQQMAEFPLSPLLAKCLLESGSYGCSMEMAIIIAMLQVQNIFIFPSGKSLQAKAMHQKFKTSEGDLLTLLNVFLAFEKNTNDAKRWSSKYYLNYKALCRAENIRASMEKILNNFEIPIKSCDGDTDAVCKCITSGMFANAAYLHYSGVYHTVRGNQELHIHPSSTLYTLAQPQWVLFTEVLHTSRMFMRDLTVIDPLWLLEIAPHFYEKSKLNKVF